MTAPDDDLLADAVNEVFDSGEAADLTLMADLYDYARSLGGRLVVDNSHLPPGDDLV